MEILWVCLDTTYFAENRKFIVENNIKKKNWITVHSPKHYTFALIYYSCPMNSARVAGKKRKRKKQNKTQMQGE